MSFSNSLTQALHDLAVELFGAEVTIYAAEDVPEDLAHEDPDFVVIVPDGCATLADELALADAIETSQPGTQPVIKLIARSHLVAERAQS